MKEIRTEIEIDASPPQVWSKLADLEGQAKWNPLVNRIEGELREGAVLSIELQLAGGRTRRFRATVTKVKVNEELRWVTRALVPGLFDVEQIFRLEALEGGRTRFVQRAEFRGLLSPLLARERFEEDARQRFEALNRGLKQRAEGDGPAGAGVG